MSHGARFHKCTCPRCGEEHKSRIHWTSKNKPRIYCKSCKGIVERAGSSMGPSNYITHGRMIHSGNRTVLDSK